MAKRIWWQLPKIRKDEDQHRDRRVSWLELFFDLVFVAAISQLSVNLAKDATLVGVAKFSLLFASVWWVWIGSTFYNERFETEGLENRLFTFLIVIPTAGLAIFAHNGLSTNYVGFALSYFFARLIINILWARAGYHERVFRPVAIRYAFGFSLSNVLVLISVFVSHPFNLVLLGIGLLSDFATPFFTLSQVEKLPRFSTSRLPERFGIVILIVLGEAVAAVVQGLANKDKLSAKSMEVGILGITLSFCFCWIYFDFIARRAAHPRPLASFFWAYLHVPLVMAIIATSGGILNIVNDTGSALPVNIKILIAASTAFCIICMGLIETTLKREKDEPSHSIYSPLLKFAVAIPAIMLCFMGNNISAVVLLLILIASMIFVMAYGTYVWFSQENVQ